MSLLSNNTLAGSSGQGGGGYEIERSLRFNSGDSADLRRVHASGGSKSKFTISCWLKKCKSGDNNYLLGRDGSFGVYVTATDKLHLDLYAENGSSWAVLCDSQAVLRDFSAWYHIVVVLDTSAGTTNADRIKFWLNGVQQTFDFTVYWGGLITGNIDSFNDNASHSIGSRNGSYYGNSYLAEYYFIDGQTLAPSDFGEYDLDNVWQPIEYVGTYGTNGVKLNFSDTSSNAALGTDSSGNGNTWTVNNLTAAGNSYTYTNAVTTTEGGGAFYSGTAANLFSASTNLLGGYSSSDHDSNIIWTPPGGVAVNNPKITASYYTKIKINGTTVASETYGGAHAEQALSFVGTLNTLVIENTDGLGSVVRAYGIKPDGTNLVTITDSASTDALRDSPSQIANQTDTGVGGKVIGNYATLNPLHKSPNTTLSNGNLDLVNTTTWGTTVSTIGMSSGKWYAEVTITGTLNYPTFGVSSLNSAYTTSYFGQTADSYVWFGYSGAGLFTAGAYTNNTGDWVVNSVAGDVIGLALDMDNGTLKYYRNGTLLGGGNAFTGITGTQFFATCGYGHTENWNFGQRAFAYPVSGYKALCTANLPDPTIADGSQYFDTKLYVGNGGTQAVSGLNFRPEFTWIKGRSGAGNHHLFDVVRGVNKSLHSDNAASTETTAAGLTSFDSNGFSLGNSNNDINGNGITFTSWNWDAGSSNTTIAAGSISSGVPSIASTVRANPSAGFSITKFSAASSMNWAHGLNAAPDFVLLKGLENTSAWYTYHSGAPDKLFYLDGTSVTNGTYFTAVDSNTVTAPSLSPGTTDEQIAYQWSAVEGYSAMGSYVGNGSADGPFVFTGFKPAFILIKATAGSEDWAIVDSKRLGHNSDNYRLFASSSVAEAAATYLDILSNGFKLTSASGNVNSSMTYIYAAFASHFFKTSRAR